MIGQPDLISDYLPAVIARNAGLQQVESNNETWMTLALLEVENVRRSSQWANVQSGFTGEDLRHMIRSVGKPDSPNAYGALVMTLVKRKVLIATGEYRAMKDKKSHARKTPIYTWSN